MLRILNLNTITRDETRKVKGKIGEKRPVVLYRDEMSQERKKSTDHFYQSDRSFYTEANFLKFPASTYVPFLTCNFPIIRPHFMFFI